MDSKRSAFGRDGGLQARMVFTIFMLGLLYAALIGALIATSTGVVLILVIVVALFAVQLIGSDKIALATLGAHEVSASDEPELHAIIERLCIQADAPRADCSAWASNQPSSRACSRTRSRTWSTAT